MVQVTLIIYSAAESREFPMLGQQLSIGRGDDVTLKLKDEGLSRLHATIYRDDDRVWILDEVSTNGTCVNGTLVPPAGSPLSDGDEITIGNDTAITVSVRKVVASASVAGAKRSAAGSAASSFNIWPIVAALVVLFVILIAALAIRLSRGEAVANSRQSNYRRLPSPSPTNDPGSSHSKPIPTASPSASITPVPARKTYLEMTEQEKKKFIEQRAEGVARMIGNREAEAVTPEAVLKIKSFVDTFALRVRRPKLTTECTPGNWQKFDLTTVLERGSKNAPFIIRAFNEKQIGPQIGLYLAMIESEYCVCLQSPTGPLGMFQFTQASGRTYGLKIISGASPSNPDERCKPDAAAGAAAGYMKFLMGRYGTGPLSVPLAIASYNSGEGGLSNNLLAALAGAAQERSFWTLVANQGKLSRQFQKENIKYVPKFFAAAIVGENPQDFGVQLQPLSSYTQ